MADAVPTNGGSAIKLADGAVQRVTKPAPHDYICGSAVPPHQMWKGEGGWEDQCHGGARAVVLCGKGVVDFDNKGVATISLS